MPVHGARELIVSFGQIESRLRQHIETNLKTATETLFREVTRNASLTDHALDRLAAMGHPYATRRPQAIHTPNWLVHRQSGRLARGIFQYQMKTPTGFRGAVGVDPNEVPYIRYVVYGTRYMVSRDFLGRTLQQHKKTIEEQLVKGFGNQFQRSALR